MKKKLFFIILLTISLYLVGCTKGEDSDAINQSNIKSKTIEKNQSEQNPPEETTIVEDSSGRFFVLGKQKLSDNTTITVLVDKRTNVMYVMTEKHYQGYGVGLEVMLNSEGKPLLYEEGGDYNY